ncbi:unnamed protein product, partial [Ectocarpus sp. 12 AP-2014]
APRAPRVAAERSDVVQPAARVPRTVQVFQPKFLSHGQRKRPDPIRFCLRRRLESRPVLADGHLPVYGAPSSAHTVLPGVAQGIGQGLQQLSARVARLNG